MNPKIGNNVDNQEIPSCWCKLAMFDHENFMQIYLCSSLMQYITIYSTIMWIQ